MFRTVRLAALTLGITLAFSGLSLARDNDNDKDDHHDRHVRHEADHNKDLRRDDRRRDDRRDRELREERARERNNGYYNGRNSAYNGNRYGYGAGSRGSALYNRGYQDGMGQARRDVSQRKPFHPDPRGGENRGRDYNNGYRAGYESTFRGGRGYLGR